MKLDDLLYEADPEDDEPKTADLKDLSKHKYNIRLGTSAHVIEKMTDEEFSKLISDIESSKEDDFLVWHFWEGNAYVFHVTGTKSYQAVADVTKDLRKVCGQNVSFFPSMKIRSINDLYTGMRYYDAHELKVKL